MTIGDISEGMKLMESLKSITRPKPNTIWDYVVPLSLIGLAFLVLNYATMHYEEYDPYKDRHVLVEKSIWEIRDALTLEFIYIVFIISITTFLTRVQRLLIPTLLLIFWIVYRILYNMDIYILDPLMGIVLLISIFTIPYFFPALSLLIEFGNNSREKIGRKPTPIRSAVAWGIYGFLIGFLPIFILPSFGTGIHREFIFEKIFRLLDPLFQLSAILYFSFFPILFALIGYAIEKYRGRKEGTK